jgi:hypothetical protein
MEKRFKDAAYNRSQFVSQLNTGSKEERYLCMLIILFYAKAIICNLLRMTVYLLLKESLYHGRLTVFLGYGK